MSYKNKGGGNKRGGQAQQDTTDAGAYGNDNKATPSLNKQQSNASAGSISSSNRF